MEHLDNQTKLTGNQYKIIAAAILGDMLEFFDLYLVGFVLAIIIKPWNLTFGLSAVILLSSGVGAMLGAAFWGYVADRIGRKAVFIATVLNFSIATGIMVFTPDNGWLFLTVFRFLTGFGVGGLYSVDLPLVQEFVPSSKRGFISGMITSAVPVGNMLAAMTGAFLAPHVGWRGLFVVGLMPALLTLLVRAWVPESPRWLARMGRAEEARKSLAWALEVNPETIPLSAVTFAVQEKPRFSSLFQYPRSLCVSWLGNLGMQTGAYGMNLWAPTLLVLVLKTTPAHAAFLFMWCPFAGFFGRIMFSYLSDAIGRRKSGALLGVGAAAAFACAGIFYNHFIGTVSVFWLMLIVAHIFEDGGFAIVGPYSAEVWPAHLRATGMGSAYGFGGLGKIIGPLGLAMIVGTSNIVKPQASIDALTPAFIFLGAFSLMAGIVYGCFGIETKGRSFESLDSQLAGDKAARKATAVNAGSAGKS
ncbi:MAG: MFS transporter [Candidatus Korobacteraceae bacterium]|jgi:putative MFS transporter